MTSFNKTKPAVAAAPVQTENETTTVAVASPAPFKIGTVSGQVSQNDIVHPSLNIVHPVGPLSEEFTPGQVVIDRQFVVAEPEKPVNLTFLAFRKFFLENVPYGGDAQAREFNSEEDLKAAGLHTNWVDNTKPPAGPAGDALIAVESTSENPLFPFTFGGKHYAIVKWRMTGGSYNRAGKLVLTASQWNLKDGLHNGSWALSTRRDKVGANFVWLPVLKAGPRNSKELADFFVSLV